VVGEDSGGGGHSDKEDIWLYGALGGTSPHQIDLLIVARRNILY